MPLIVRFYDVDVQARDSRGRTQEEILAWSDTQLESCHNYIQMLFPVPEGSAFNWEAPIIDRETMDTFRSRKDLRDRLRQSFERMLGFYGFTVEIQPADEKDAAEPKDADIATGGRHYYHRQVRSYFSKPFLSARHYVRYNPRHLQHHPRHELP
jgi:hypothetical protein